MSKILMVLFALLGCSSPTEPEPHCLIIVDLRTLPYTTEVTGNCKVLPIEVQIIHQGGRK